MGNDRQLVSSALTMAVWRRGMVNHVIVHSDQGSTYASSDYQQLLNQHRLICSMSRKGEVRVSLFHYIETFYNRKRRHSFLDYLSPVEFEAKRAS